MLLQGALAEGFCCCCWQHRCCCGHRCSNTTGVAIRLPPCCCCCCSICCCRCRLLTCWKSCETTDWNRSTTSGLGGGGPWLHVMAGCRLLLDTSNLHERRHKPHTRSAQQHTHAHRGTQVNLGSGAFPKDKQQNTLCSATLPEVPSTRCLPERPAASSP